MKCEIVEKVSKTGNKYVVLQVQLTPSYTKDVFLESAELELIKLYAQQNSGK